MLVDIRVEVVIPGFFFGTIQQQFKLDHLPVCSGKMCVLAAVNLPTRSNPGCLGPRPQHLTFDFWNLNEPGDMGLANGLAY